MEHINPPNLLTWGVSGRYLRAAGVLWSSLSVVLKVGVATRIWWSPEQVQLGQWHQWLCCGDKGCQMCTARGNSDEPEKVFYRA